MSETIQLDIGERVIDFTFEVVDISFEFTESVVEFEFVEEKSIELTFESGPTVDITFAEEVIEISFDVLEGGGGGGGGGTGNIYLEFDQIGNVVVGDLIYMNPIVANLVDRATSNNTPNPIIGIATAIINESRVQCCIWGMLKIASPVSGSRKLYVSSIGKITTAPPASGKIQYLGFTSDGENIFFNPDNVRIKQLEIL